MEAGHFSETSEQTIATWCDNPNNDHYMLSWWIIDSDYIRVLASGMKYTQ